MRVEFTVPMEGPRTALHPKGVSRRPGDQETVPDAEALTMVERGLAHLVDDDGYPVKITTAEHHARRVAVETGLDVETVRQMAAEDEADQVIAASRQPTPERAVQQPARPVERTVTQPTPAQPGAPKGASGGRKTAKS